MESTVTMPRYYELRPALTEDTNPGEFRFTSAAFISCGLCRRTIDTMGGPGDGVICQECGDALKAGRLRGTVKWDKREDE